MIGGSEAVYFRTAEILEKKGQHSIYFSMRHPDNLPCNTAEYFVPYIDLDKCGGTINLLRATGNVLYSIKAKKLLSRLLDRYSVDVAHIHNIQRQMSPSILHVLKNRKIPVVMTLHEYKMVCPSFNMLIDERPCEACAEGRYFNAVRLSCIKNSRYRSALASVEMFLHHKILNIYRNVDVFISPSQFLKNKHKEMGFQREIVHLPNCIDVQKFDKFRLKEKEVHNDKVITIVYFGRLYHGKGLFTLLDAVKKLTNVIKKKQIMVKIIGEGPVEEEMKEKARTKGIKNIKFLGNLSGEELFQEVKKAYTVVLPSECYENNPLQVIESFAMGIPVVGARIAGIPELVKDYKTGLTFEPGNPEDLCSKIEYMINNPDKAAEIGKNARVFIEQELNAEKHYVSLMNIYEKAISLVK